MSSSDGASAMDQIPRAFHDVISRIVPGFTLIGSACFLALGTGRTLWMVSRFLDGPGQSVGVVTSTVAVLLLASYVLAMLLAGLSEAVGIKRLLNRCVPWGGDYLAMRGIITLHLPEIGNRLDKIRAECGLCEHLFTGWLLLAVACPFVHYIARPPAGWSFPAAEYALVPLIILAFLQRNAQRKHLVDGLDFWYKQALLVRDQRAATHDSADSLPETAVTSQGHDAPLRTKRTHR